MLVVQYQVSCQVARSSKKYFYPLKSKQIQQDSRNDQFLSCLANPFPSPRPVAKERGLAGIFCCVKTHTGESATGRIRVSISLKQSLVSRAELDFKECDFSSLNDRSLCLHKVSFIVFCPESAHGKQCAGKGVNVTSGSVIVICTAVWRVYVKNISLSYLVY